MKSFTLNPHPASTLRIRVFIHPSKRAMDATRQKGASKSYSAYCRQFGYDDRFRTGLLAELHFRRGDTKRNIIVHEAAHAAIHYLHVIMLDTKHQLGDEHLAEAMEHIVEGVINGIAMDFRRKPTA